ncbi:MAG: hypothetical protein ACI841_001303 [Planctomycetota bacterium]
MANVAGDGTMKGSPNESDSSTSPPGADPTAVGGGLGAAWWSARNASLASKWSEHIRQGRTEAAR